MINIKPDIVRRVEIWKQLKNIIEDKWQKITEIATKMWLKSHNSISNALNWTIPWSDKLLEKIADTIWLSENEYKEIKKSASKLEYEYEFWEKINDKSLGDKDPEELLDEVISLNFRHSWINNKKAEEEAKAVIEFLINKYHKK